MSGTKVSPENHSEDMNIPLGHFSEDSSFPARHKTAKSKSGRICAVSGTTGIQEESTSLSVPSQIVILGNVFIVKELLQATYLDKSSTYGVIVDHELKGTEVGRFEKDKDFSVLRKLGQGGFGKVDLCKTHSGQEFVMKTVAERFNRKEVEVLMSLSHPNITAFKGYIYRGGNHEILMDFAGISLQTFVDSNPTSWQLQLTNPVINTLTEQGLSALEYLHENSILHLDIKPDNICVLLGESLSVLKLTDFGSCKMAHQSLSFSGWTPEYMSPEACSSYMASVKPEIAEALDRFEVTGKSDMFAFGLIVYFMVRGRHAVIERWKTHLTPDNFAAFRPNFVVYLAQNIEYLRQWAVEQLKCSGKLQDLVLALLRGDPNVRPNAAEAISYLADDVMDEVVPPLVSPADLLTSPMTCDPPLVTDISLKNRKKADTSGGGKDIKNSLRQKILRRKSTEPYFRAAEQPASPGENNLPDFSALF